MKEFAIFMGIAFLIWGPIFFWIWKTDDDCNKRGGVDVRGTCIKKECIAK